MKYSQRFSLIAIIFNLTFMAAGLNPSIYLVVLLLFTSVVWLNYDVEIMVRVSRIIEVVKEVANTATKGRCIKVCFHLQ